MLWDETPIGSIEIENKFHPISASEVGDHVMQHLFMELLQAQQQVCAEDLWLSFVDGFRDDCGHDKTGEISPRALPMGISVVVATYDRPDDLRLVPGRA